MGQSGERPWTKGASSPEMLVVFGGCCTQYRFTVQSARSSRKSHQNQLFLMCIGTEWGIQLKLPWGNLEENVGESWKNRRLLQKPLESGASLAFQLTGCAFSFWDPTLSPGNLWIPWHTEPSSSTELLGIWQAASAMKWAFMQEGLKKHPPATTAFSIQ